MDRGEWVARSQRGFVSSSKEAVAEITRRIEDVRADYATGLERFKAERVQDVERLKAGLALDASVRQAQYDAERKTYAEVWSTLAKLQDSVGGLRNVVHYHSSLREGDKERASELVEEYMKALHSFKAVVQVHRPFYPDEVHHELRALIARVTRQIGVGLGEAPFADKFSVVPDASDSQYLTAAVAGGDAISAQVDRVCDVIRARLARVGAGAGVLPSDPTSG